MPSLSGAIIGNIIYESTILLNYFFGNIYCEAIRSLPPLKFFLTPSDNETISIKANHSKGWDAKLLA